MTVFGSLLADAVRESFPTDRDELYADAKDEEKVPEADTTMITAIMDQHREEADAKVAMDLARECTRDFVARERAAAKQEEEDAAFANDLERELKDEGLASRLQREFDVERNVKEFDEKPGLDRDELYAKAVHDACRADVAAAEAAAEAKDAGDASRYQVKVRRQDHRERKARAARAEAKDEGLTVGERWANALGIFELEDVGGAIVVSLRLPDLVSVSVKPVDKRFVLLTASRAKPFGDAGANDARDGPTGLKMKLELESPGCCLRQEDLSYDYDSTTGYLHIYCEHLKLATLGEQRRKAELGDLRKRLATAFQSHAARVAGKVRGDAAVLSDRVRGNASAVADKVRSAVARAPTRRIDAV